MLRQGLLPVLALLCATASHAQVFTVGEKSATADMKVDFKPTHVELPEAPLTERGRRELMRDLASELGFAHRVLPLGAVLTLQANGQLTPRDDQYKDMVYRKGTSAAPGDRVQVTALAFHRDRILIDLNGGPYVKHRFLRHVQIGVGGVASPEPDLSELPTGCRITLVFEGGIPEISAPEVKALLQPVIDFSVKTGEQAYADTLPEPLKDAIQHHDVMVGMNHRMVLAALGQPESKIREGNEAGKYEEWIYGHQPQTMHFVRFVGDRVSLVKIAALGKPIEVHDQDEMAGYLAPATTTPVGDTADAAAKAGPPSLRLPDEATTPADSQGQIYRKVQMPGERPSDRKDSPAQRIPPVPSTSDSAAPTIPTVLTPPPR